jgi:hypothetical protein
MYYVYVHTKPSGEIFYVGKGKKNRAYDECYRNRHWNFIAKKHGFNAIILAEFEEEQKALDEEVLLISYFRKFGTLTNITEGGDANPMKNSAIAKKVAATKRAKGQYDNVWKKYNDMFKEKMNDPLFAKQISEKRKVANLCSLVTRKKIEAENAKKVNELRLQGLKYKDISSILSLSVGFISKVLNQKDRYAEMA